MVAHVPAEKLVGMVLGNYRLEQLLEQAKAGPVFQARSRDGSTYTIRFIGMPSPGNSSGPMSEARVIFLGRFQQEANQLASLQHPHILPVLDYSNLQGIPYLVYPSGSLPSLRSLSAEHGPADVQTVGRYLRQIASALEYAHGRAILHRNLSSSCVFVQSNQQTVVAEFGLMRLMELSKQAETDSAVQRYEGSSESSSPEQLLGKPVDIYTDIYALGAILYRLLAGHAPFAGQTREEVARQHLYAQVPPLAKWRADLPAGLDPIIARAMAKEPLQRFQHVVALVEAYYQIVDPQNVQRAVLATSGVTPVVRPPTLPSRSTPLPSSQQPSMPRMEAVKSDRVSRRRLFTWVGAGGGTAIVAAVIAGFYLTHRAAAGNTASASTGSVASGQNVAAPASSTSVPTGAVPQATTPGGKLLAHIADVPLNSAKQFPIDNQHNPGLLIHLPNNHFVAYDSTCTHAGCSVDYSSQNSMLTCPCHGAVFDPANKAAVVQGPARTPLAAVNIMVNADGTITTT